MFRNMHLITLEQFGKKQCCYCGRVYCVCRWNWRKWFFYFEMLIAWWNGGDNKMQNMKDFFSIAAVIFYLKLLCKFFQLFDSVFWENLCMTLVYKDSYFHLKMYHFGTLFEYSIYFVHIKDTPVFGSKFQFNFIIIIFSYLLEIL